MSNQNFTTGFSTRHSAIEVFEGVNNVRGWWSENIIGETNAVNDEFLYQYKDVHACKIRITELVPGKKISWKVLENQFNFTADKHEWKGNTIQFEINENGAESELMFTHIGLVPAYECYEICRDAWTSYIKGSLKDLIETGQGKPNTKEHDLNRELIEKWGLPVR